MNRSVATGTVQVKIFQRQSHKKNIPPHIVVDKEDIEGRHPATTSSSCSSTRTSLRDARPVQVQAPSQAST